MAKLSAGMAGKLKNLARGLKEDDGSVKKSGGDGKQSEVHKKQPLGNTKASGRKE